ncbi:MAPEG family protein [Spirulina sp. CS-785/01]|uniref:MAPEG family protein n=1 Tax=Spirulina sp. CS-785/01 TaxID=3021716 RepID=UPI00232BAE16|nr:MAPEG family protein [Spirulina sp. CS-785/01]MDB9311673.1 MAPEG family protein [Spirulina sp. CS-785/01]
MTPDLISLLILALWSIPLNHIPAVGRTLSGGVEWAMTNRDKLPETDPWVGRGDRAQRNHHDNLAMIAIVILTAQITGRTDKITAIASIVVVSFRILHGIAYLIGIPILRSLSYFISLLALFVIVWRIIAPQLPF